MQEISISGCVYFYDHHSNKRISASYRISETWSNANATSFISLNIPPAYYNSTDTRLSGLCPTRAFPLPISVLYIKFHSASSTSYFFLRCQVGSSSLFIEHFYGTQIKLFSPVSCIISLNRSVLFLNLHSYFRHPLKTTPRVSFNPKIH